MTRVDVVGLSVAYDSVPALSGVSLRVPEASWIGVIGPNGAGKSTLLRAIAGLVGPRGGEVRLDGAALSSLSRRSLSRLVAYVPQRPVLPEGMTVTDYVLLGRTPYIGYLGMEGRSDLGVVGNVLERLELRHFAGRVLGSLSGGEVQRVVLGRALAQQAPVLLLDEPTAALDIGHAQQVLELIEELRSEHRLTVISSMHDLTLAGQFAERLILLAGGRVVAGGPARGVLTEAT
ncbi:MAG TPA: ABC transporter ATP-binding protein, partial [Candidatus Caenarcaniphilales bacterium]|nr:ABC transporter ATP-binding protein [Candidatus Caenarcaniphilales bacterium]